MNSRVLIAAARGVFFQWLTLSSAGQEPLGVVLCGDGPTSRGRVVFDLPVLLPGEHYVPVAWLGLRPPARSRPPRAGGSRQASPSAPD